MTGLHGVESFRVWFVVYVVYVAIIHPLQAIFLSARRMFMLGAKVVHARFRDMHAL
jgi:hypothetical protein